MDEQSKAPESQEKQAPKFRGLYRYVNISVKSLDRIILACVAVIILIVALELRNPGFTVTFDSKGGTDVPPQNQMYGQLLEEPEPPSRQGYVFSGWYKDYACDLLWDMETDIIETDITLYAGWQTEQ